MSPVGDMKEAPGIAGGLKSSWEETRAPRAWAGSSPVDKTILSPGSSPPGARLAFAPWPMAVAGPSPAHELGLKWASKASRPSGSSPPTEGGAAFTERPKNSGRVILGLATGEPHDTGVAP